MIVEKNKDYSPQPKTKTASQLTTDEIMQCLDTIQDPDLHISIVKLGLIYKIENIDGIINVAMTLTSPGCPYGPQLMQEVKSTLNCIQDVKEVNLELLWDPPWTIDNLSQETRLELGLDIGI